MATYRCTFFWESSGMGFSETWLTKDVSQSNLATRVLAMVNLRAAMLPSSYSFQGVRMAQLGAGRTEVGGIRTSRLLVPGANFFPGPNDKLTLQPVGTYLGEGLVLDMEQFRSNLQIRLSYNGGKTTTRYVVGIPDALSKVTAGLLDPNVAPAWVAAFSAWRAEIVANWQIVARTTFADDPLIVVKALIPPATTGGPLGIAFTPPDGLNWAIGDIATISGFRFKAGSPKVSINGGYHISGITPNSPQTGLNTYFLRELTGVDPNNIKILGKVRRRQKTTYSIDLIDVIRLGIHKRGKASLVPRGRRLARTTLDP